jgi:hypothetical protein
MDDDQHDARYHDSDNQHIHDLPPPSLMMCVTGNVLDTGHAGCPLVTGDPHPLFQKRAKCDMKEINGLTRLQRF